MNKEYAIEPPQLIWSTVMFRKRRTENGKQATEAKTQLRKAQEKLHSLDANSDAISFDPATPKQYIRAIQGLVASMVDPAEKPDAKAVDTIRTLVSEIVVSPVENDSIPVEVKGRVSAFVSNHEYKVGGLVVAEEGLEPPTRGL